MTRLLRSGLIAVALWIGASSVQADEALLTVQVGETEHRFTLAQLELLPVTSFETSTIWTVGSHRFTGVSLADLAAHLGIVTGELLATAINDYHITIPLEDAVTPGPIIAYEIDGEPMPRREKGPLWIVYPYDMIPAYQTETIYSRSIWQLVRLDVQ
ncbi:molybdopterin-dependent oxidoreductase [Poseidonocella pacifica]|nr:molybdopterin-dependent oxidoreductase [Poseidonocella pacifica]